MTLGKHGPIQSDVRKKMNDLAGKLDEMFNGPLRGLNRKWGFALLVFPFGGSDGEERRMNYIGNANRAQMLVAMKELVQRWENDGALEPTEKNGAPR